MHSRISIDRLILGTTAFILSGALLRFLTAGSEKSEDGDTQTQIIRAVVYLAVAAFALADARRTSWSIRRTPLLTALLLLAFVSALWAEVPDLVLRRAVALAGTCLFGIVLAIRFSFAEQLQLLRWVFRLAGGLSAAIIAVGHGVITLAGQPSMRGAFNHKNRLGAAMAVAVLVEWYLPETKRLPKILRWLFLALFVGLLVFSNSMTSIVTVGITLLVMRAFETIYRRYRLLMPVLFSILLVGGSLLALAGANVDSVTDLLGRSSDLTGRTELWGAVTTQILDHPLLGFGFSGFWQGGSSESYVVEHDIGWSPSYSHNGYLEILLSLGVVGLLLFLFVLKMGIRRALFQADTRQSLQDQWPLAFLVFFTIHNLAECTILWQNCLEWSLCVATIVGSDPMLRMAFILERNRQNTNTATSKYA